MKGPHSGDAFLQVATGPDVSEDGHAAMLCFIRTCRNGEMTPSRGAAQTGVSAAEPAGGARKLRNQRKDRPVLMSRARRPETRA